MGLFDSLLAPPPNLEPLRVALERLLGRSVMATELPLETVAEAIESIAGRLDAIEAKLRGLPD